MASHWQFCFRLPVLYAPPHIIEENVLTGKLQAKHLKDHKKAKIGSWFQAHTWKWSWALLYPPSSNVCSQGVSSFGRNLFFINEERLCTRSLFPFIVLFPQKCLPLVSHGDSTVGEGLKQCAHCRAASTVLTGRQHRTAAIRTTSENCVHVSGKSVVVMCPKT